MTHRRTRELSQDRSVIREYRGQRIRRGRIAEKRAFPKQERERERREENAVRGHENERMTRYSTGTMCASSAYRFTCTCACVRRSYSEEDVGKKKHHTVVKKRRTVLGSGGGGGGRAT